MPETRCGWSLVLAFASACGGRLASGDSTSTAPDAAVDAGDAAISDDASDAAAPVEPCSEDASYDAPLCTPPADDVLYASPAVLNVAAGSYGYAQFFATGPWASDPSMLMIFEGSTLQLGSYPGLDGYGPAQSFIFLLPSTATGQTGALTVLGRAGNIERMASVTVNVTNCQPWPASKVCVNEECGFEPDNCGGLVSCGDCPPQTPYCAGEVTPAGFEHLCSATMPVYCPNGEGITWGGCIPCTQTIACTTCHDGVCLGIQDECLCQRGG